MVGPDLQCLTPFIHFLLPDPDDQGRLGRFRNFFAFKFSNKDNSLYFCIIVKTLKITT